MKIQTIDTSQGERYLLLDDNYRVVDEVRRYLKHLDSCGKSPNTLKSYAFNLKLFYDYMSAEKIPIKDLCRMEDKGPVEIISSFMLWLQYPSAASGLIYLQGEDCIRTNKTVNHIVDTVLSFYQYLASNNEIQELDVYKKQRTSSRFKSFLYELIKHKKDINKSIFRKPVPDVPVVGITRAQYNILFGLCTIRRDKLICALMYEGGLRLGEVLGLHVCDINEIEDGVVRIVPRENNENGARVKRIAGGVIKLPNYVVDLLLDYINADIIEYDSDFLFLNLNGPTKGTPMKPSTVEKLLTQLSVKAGFEVHPHMLRHGFAEEKLSYGWDMVDIQAYLRHKNISSTQIYAKYSDELKIEKMRAFFSDKKIFLGGAADAIIRNGTE